MRRLTVFALALIHGPALAQVADITTEPLPPANPAVEQFMSGKFPPLIRPKDIPGGHIQRKWDQAPRGAGVLEAEWEPAETIRANLRTGMVTTLVLPINETIVDWSLGDQENFNGKPVEQQKNKLWLWATAAGYDTNLNIVGKTGAVYTVYLRGEAWNSEQITTQVIRIKSTAPNLPEKTNAAAVSSAAAPPPNAAAQQSVTILALNSPDIPPEWVRKGCIFDPTQIRHDRVMKGDSSIAPVLVYRDACFTYFDWGEKHEAATMPGIWQMVDKVDQPVAYDMSRDGRFQVIRSTQPLTLRLGEKTTCITEANKR